MLEGEINQINLIDRLVEMWREQFTGAIRFESDGIIKIVYFKGGDILSASTNDRADSIDEILMRAGKVSREHVKQALAKRKENETLGDALLNLGFITRKELSWARRVQVVGVIRSIAAWTAGSFTIVADYLPKRDEGTQFAVPQIVVELIVTEGDRQKFEKVLDGGSVVFSKAADFDDVFRRLGLNEEAEQISREIDGDKSAADVAAASGKDTFNVYKLLHALATLRVLTASQTAPRVTDVTIDDFVTAGVSDAADMWEPTPEAEAEVPVEPVIQAQPMFELDEAEAIQAPTLEVPMAYDAPPPTPATSAWDDEDEPATAQAWSEPPVELSEPMLAETEEAPIPTMTPAEARSVAADGQWGFDEAQLEAARRVSVPVPASAKTTDAPAAFARKQKPKSKSPFGLVIALMVVFILGAAGYFGFMAWKARQTEPAPPVVQPPQPKPAVAAQTGTIVSTETSATAPATTTLSGAVPASGAGATTTTTAEAAVAPPVTATPAPAPVPPVAATPMVIAPTPAGGRDRYDAMARDFLANASGNFTVQIQILCEASNLDKVLKAGGADVWFVPQPIGARSCYRVLWGRFATREEAQRAMAQVPAALRDPSAAVKPVPK